MQLPPEQILAHLRIGELHREAEMARLSRLAATHDGARRPASAGLRNAVGAWLVSAGRRVMAEERVEAVAGRGSPGRQGATASR